MRFKLSPKLAAIPLVLCAGQMFATQAMAAPVTWTAYIWGNPERAFVQNIVKLSEEVKERTNDEFIIEIKATTVTPKQNLDQIKNKAVEMAQFCVGYHAHKNRTLTILELPFLGVETLTQERKVSEEFYRLPEVKREMKEQWGARLLMPSPLPQYNLVGHDKPLRNLEDFEGKRIRATGGIGAALELIGAVPRSVSATEVEQLLNQGALEAVAFAPHAHLAFNTVKKARWWTTNLNPGTVNCPVAVGIEAFEELSDEHRQALLASVEPALDHYIDNYEKTTMADWKEEIAQRRIERITYSPQTIDDFRERAATPAVDELLEELEKFKFDDGTGVNGKELLEKARSLIKKHSSM